MNEHPEILCSDKDSIHYFDMFYHFWEDWYYSNFDKESYKEDKKLFDPTPSYIRSPLAPKRIYEYNPDAKIILTIRNPIERAFSHYWHEKKKKKINFSFEEVFENYDLFSSRVEPWMYYMHIKRYLQYFNKDQILLTLFNEISENPEKYVKEVFSFVWVDDKFKPQNLYKTYNKAWFNYKILNHISANLKSKLKFKENNIFDKFFAKIWRKEYEVWMSEDIRKKLKDVFKEDMDNLSKEFNVDISKFN